MKGEKSADSGYIWKVKSPLLDAELKNRGSRDRGEFLAYSNRENIRRRVGLVVEEVNGFSFKHIKPVMSLSLSKGNIK